MSPAKSLSVLATRAHHGFGRRKQWLRQRPSDSFRAPGSKIHEFEKHLTTAERKHREHMRDVTVRSLDVLGVVSPFLAATGRLRTFFLMWPLPFLFSQEKRDIEQEIRMSHKQKVAKLNDMLSSMPEAHDLPRVGPG